ncbi:MAG: hypothetical protein ACTH1D_04095 [Mycobacteriaceae bacterium]|uniref:hypothetical protein n=1 Tax=Corynebacterium sp. TaxID=1720 RepID=UPI003F97EA15
MSTATAAISASPTRAKRDWWPIIALTAALLSLFFIIPKITVGIPLAVTAILISLTQRRATPRGRTILRVSLAIGTFTLAIAALMALFLIST